MAPRAQRKLAAILAADVVGYSRLVGTDEAGTIARLKALRKEFIEPLIAEYHGCVAKLMGDGALVEFASVVDAVECAAAIQNGVAERQAERPERERIAFRIGINIGDVIIEEGDIYGDGVNVAARLEQLAGPGKICVSRTDKRTCPRWRRSMASMPCWKREATRITSNAADGHSTRSNGEPSLGLLRREPPRISGAPPGADCARLRRGARSGAHA